MTFAATFTSATFRLPRLARIVCLAALGAGLAGEGRAAVTDADQGGIASLSPALARFVKEKRELLERIARKNELTTPSLVTRFFDMAQSGNWLVTSNIFYRLSATGGQSGPSAKVPPELWGPVLETFGAYDQFRSWNPELLQLFGGEILKTVPPGSVYFGGTDAGRFVVSALCSSQTEGRPFFTLTQNGLADGSYLDYLREIYGEKLKLPTPEDFGKVFDDYAADAARREAEGKLREDEEVTVAEGRKVVVGVGAVMLINERLVKAVMAANPGLQFFQEESYPLETLYPNVLPQGLILKIEREPLEPLPAPVVERDREYWTLQARALIGPAADSVTDLDALSAYVRQVYVRREAGRFQGVPAYLKDRSAPEYFSHCRSAIASLYSWRAVHTDDQSVAGAMAKEAELAHRQAVLLAPFNPEAVWPYVRFLFEQKRTNDAKIVLGASLQLKMADWIDMDTGPKTNALAKLNKAAKELKVDVADPTRNGKPTGN